jgi:hypothetical protein
VFQGGGYRSAFIVVRSPESMALIHPKTMELRMGEVSWSDRRFDPSQSDFLGSGYPVKPVHLRQSN